LRKNFIIYDEADKLSVMKAILKNELHCDEKEFPARQIASFISNAKNALQTPKQFELSIDSPIKEIASQVYNKYQDTLRKNNALDFDDILVKTLELIRIPQILEYYSEKFQYLLVDEYQDTNTPQYEIVKLL
jgi:DNA helicase-2/ATP-dependent DNA helicase PcrA